LQEIGRQSFIPQQLCFHTHGTLAMVIYSQALRAFGIQETHLLVGNTALGHDCRNLAKRSSETGEKSSTALRAEAVRARDSASPTGTTRLRWKYSARRNERCISPMRIGVSACFSNRLSSQVAAAATSAIEASEISVSRRQFSIINDFVIMQELRSVFRSLWPHQTKRL